MFKEEGSSSVSAALNRLNNADMGALRSKLNKLREDIEAALKLQGKTGKEVANKQDIEKAATHAGVSVEEFMAALELAKRMGLI